MSETSVKLFLATKMKCAVVSALISLAFVSQAFAVLRPLFPAKPAPPFNGEVIIIGGDSVTAIQIVRPLESIAEMQPQFYRMSCAGCAQTTVQIRKEVRKDEG